MASLPSRLLYALRLVCSLGLLLMALAGPTQAQPPTPRVSFPALSPTNQPTFLLQPEFYTDYPPDLPSNLPWSADYNSVDDVVAAFNDARSRENALLGTFLKPLVAPSATAWAQMSGGEKALWLVNEERVARGLAPLQGLETNANEVAQAYAAWLLANDKFDHEEDGHTPWERLDAKPAIAACHDDLAIAENLAWQGTTSPDGVPLVMEQAVYNLIYADATSQWGHRHAILWTPYTENSGAADREGFLGIGHARGEFTDPQSGKTYPYTDMIVMNFFDPCATWVAAPPVVVPEPPTPEPIVTPLPPPQTHAAAGKTALPAWETVFEQPFEANTWPGAWEVVDTNGATNGDYRWIAAGCTVFEGDYSGMAIGGGTDGLSLRCVDDYPNNARSWLTYGPFSLDDAIGAVVEAKVWVYTEINVDMLCMMVSTDNVTYDGTCFSGNSAGWVEEQLDLSHVYRLGNLLGRSNLYFAFAFYTDGSITKPYGGAYVDNIALFKDVLRPGSALYGVDITSEDGQTTITDQAGNFSLAGLTPGKHVLTPSKLGFEFYPASIEVDVSAGDVGNLQFVGVPRLLLSEMPYSVHLPLIRPQ